MLIEETPVEGEEEWKPEEAVAVVCDCVNLVAVAAGGGNPPG